MQFADIKSAVEDAYGAEREMGFLRLVGMRQPVTFFAAQRIVRDDSAAALEACPPWLVAELYRWIDSYRDDGHLISHSSAGSADHTDLAISLAKTLPPKADQDWPLELIEVEERYPSGKVHRFFTHYVSPGEGIPVAHGLHREYTESGQLTETEFRHGSPVGEPRRFDSQGRELGR
jgi:hypothetical protein